MKPTKANVFTWHKNEKELGQEAAGQQQVNKETRPAEEGFKVVNYQLKVVKGTAQIQSEVGAVCAQNEFEECQIQDTSDQGV